MITYTQPSFSIDKEKLYRQLHIADNHHLHQFTESVFETLMDIVKKKTQLITCYSLMDNHRLNLPGIDHCAKAVLCFCTCSHTIDCVINDMMDAEKFLEGFLINHMVNEVLFNASNQMNAQVECTLLDQDLKLTPVHFPGVLEIDMKCQATLLALLKEEAPIEATLTDGYMIDPEKSMLYYYGADTNIEGHSTAHNCSQCNAQKCPHRNVL